MNLKYLLLICFVFGSFYISAQTIVGTDPENKNVILEEFTGQNCPNCPAGHATAQSILNDHPEDVFVIAYHPTNSSFTLPELDEPFPDAFYSTPYCGSGRFMPSAFIDRRLYSSERLQSRSVWESYTNSQLTESSPVNVGVQAEYDYINETLDIYIEAYYTSDVTDDQSINVMLIEDGIVAYQSNGGSDYVHNHIFREAFTAQWGDPIANTSNGDIFTASYPFDNSTDQFNMEKCELVVFVLNTTTDEIESGFGAKVTIPNLVSVNLTSVVNDTTNVSPVPVEISFSEEMSGFELNDIQFTNCSGSNFNTSDNINFTVDLTPDSDGEIQMYIPMGATEAVSNGNWNESANFRVFYDGTNPTVVISSNESSPTPNSTFLIDIVFSEEVTGLTETDITVSNAEVLNLQTSNNISYIAEIGNYGGGSLITVNIDSDLASDLAGNGNDLSNMFEIGVLNVSELSKNIGIYTRANELVITNAGNTEFYIFDITGKIVSYDQISSDNEVFPLKIQPGIYIISIRIDYSVFSKKISLF